MSIGTISITKVQDFLKKKKSFPTLRLPGLHTVLTFPINACVI